MQKLALALIATLVLAGCVGQTQVLVDDVVKVNPTGITREYTISGITNVVTGELSFNKDKITANLGDKVRVIFTSTDTTTGHTFNIDEFDIQSSAVKNGAKDVVEFYVDKKGEFKYYCSIDGHKEKGMEGILVVE